MQIQFPKIFRRNKTIAELESRLTSLRTPSDLVPKRKLVMAAVIDDEPFAPLKNLRSHQYEIAYIDDVSDPTHVAAYDIVVCDIRDVGIEYNRALQGGGLIQAIKNLYPHKYVIAYSGSFSRNKAVTLALLHADMKISKSASLKEWTETLDAAISEVLNPISRWRATRGQLEKIGVRGEQISELEDAFVRSFMSSNSAQLRKRATTIELPSDARAIVQNLVASAIWAALIA